MVSWEYPPFFTGGAGVACEGMVRALLRRGTEVGLLLPWSGMVFNSEQTKDISAALGDGGFFDDGSSVPAGHSGRTGSSVPGGAVPGVYAEQPMPPSSVPAVPDLEHPCDLIHSHDWPTVPVAMELKNRLDVPMAFHLHSLESDRNPAGRCREIEGLERLGCRKADMIITVSKYTAGKIISEYDVPPEKVRVFYNGHTLGGKLKPENQKGQRNDNKVVLFLGRFVPQKGADIFLEAALILAGARHDVRFVMAGAGPMTGELKERASGKVIFPGFVPRREIPKLLEKTDILVVPSRSEPFGIAALEAMSRGCTVVINRTAGLTEIARNLVALEGNNPAELVRLLSGLLDNSEGMKALGRAAAEEAAGLGWDMRISDLLSLYDELV